MKTGKLSFSLHTLLCSIFWVVSCSVLWAHDPELVSDLKQRRSAAMEQMNGQGLLILFSSPIRAYSGDVEYEFRQNNNIYYLTGIRQPAVRLVLMPQNSTYREILFLPQKDPHRELWTGKMLSNQEASQISGIENVWKASEFEAFIDSVLYGRPYRVNRYLQSDEYSDLFRDLEKGGVPVFLHLKSKPGLSGEMSREFEFASRIRERFTGIRIGDATPIFNRLRMVKSPYEIRQLQHAIDITVEAHLEAMKRLQPGIWEYEIEAAVEYIFKKRNSFDWAFPSIVASGPNATTLHYTESQRQTQDGDLMLLDIGAEYNYYAADITRTFPTNGTFTREQADIYQLVLDAQKASMALVKPGSSMAGIHRKAAEVLKQGLARLGLIRDQSGNQYRAYFPHGVGHFLGLDVHDVRSGDQLEAGMVLTVEPGIYVREDTLERLSVLGTEKEELERIEPVLSRYLNIGVRIEDDVLVTENGYELLSRKAPRELKQIENLVHSVLGKQR